MGLSLITPPALEPVTLEQAKGAGHLRVMHDDEDDDVLEMIQAAREWAESTTGRQLITAVYRWSFDCFPSCGTLRIPRPPLQAVDDDDNSLVTIAYVDTAGVTQTWAASNYVVDAPTDPREGHGRIHLAYGTYWPVTQCIPNAVTITFTAGYGDAASDVPAEIRREMLRKIGSYYEHREDILADQFGQGVMELPSNAGRLASFKVYPLRDEGY